MLQFAIDSRFLRLVYPGYEAECVSGRQQSMGNEGHQVARNKSQGQRGWEVGRRIGWVNMKSVLKFHGEGIKMLGD